MDSLITFTCFIGTILVAPNMRFLIERTTSRKPGCTESFLWFIAVFSAFCFLSAEYGLDYDAISIVIYSLFCMVVSFMFAFATAPIMEEDLRYYPRCAVFFSIMATYMMGSSVV